MLKNRLKIQRAVNGKSTHYRNKAAKERKRRKIAEKMALIDPLTGAFNLRGFDLRFNEEYANFMRYKFDVALIFFDVDNFKSFNSDYGQKTGDEVLKSLVGTIRTVIRPSDSVHRIGGEEYVALLSKINLLSDGITRVPEKEAVQNAYKVAERIRKKIENIEIKPYDGDGVVKVTVSAGVALLSEAKDRDLLVEYANRAERKAKDEGKNRTYMFYEGKITEGPE